MTTPVRSVLGPAVAAILLAGCNDTARPGAGITNGPPAGVAADKPSGRNDLPTPEPPGPGEAGGQGPISGPTAGATTHLDPGGAGQVGSDVGGTGTYAGTGGRGGGRGGGRWR